VATESDLRDLLRGPDPEGRGDIDLDAVLSRTRRRRRPRVIAAQALGSVAVIGVLGTAVFVSGPLADRGVVMSADDLGSGADGAGEAVAESGDSPFADEDALKWMPDACGAPVTDTVSSGGLTLEMSMELVVEPQERIPVQVTLRNDGPDDIVGVSSPWPHVSLARDGLVVWHSYQTQEAIGYVIDLAPGESTTLETYFDRVICSTEDDLIMDGPQNDMPTAPPGQYELRAVLVVTTDEGQTLVAASAPFPLEISG
jgi:hypothetical protein